MSSIEKIFEALASTTRRKILAYLSETALSAGEIAKRFDMSQPAVSKHLSILENANLVWKKERANLLNMVWSATPYQGLWQVSCKRFARLRES